jgi:pSer/pThr/pTyr-binding forkhead associated (FHA) protein
VTGQLSLGHFDPNVGIPPDIDLTFEDQASHFISRRHATVVGQDGAHTIEDLGSRAGVFLNGTQVSNGPSRPLEEGDRISLGDIELVYEKVPTGVLIKAKSSQARHALMVTPTGRVIGLTPLKDIVIGRADPQVNFMPDIDLSVDGEVARLVSRRHAIIRWREGQPHLEDLGSGFGSRLGGETLTLGQSVPLKPGDHFWLAGCVLAYAVEL